MTTARSSLALAMLVALSGVSSTAHAQGRVSKEFTKLYEAGVDAFNLGNYEDARTRFEKARALEDKLPGPYRYLAAIAQREERWEDCLGLAATAVKLNPTSNQLGNTQTIHEACRQGLGRAPREVELGSGGGIAVTANLEGATIRLNGLRYGATPMAPRAFAAGEVEISVDAKGYLPQARTVEVVVGLVTDVAFELDVDPAAQKAVELSSQGTEEIKNGWVRFAIGDGLAATIEIDGAVSAPDAKGFHVGTPGLKSVAIRVEGAEPWRRRVRFVRGQRRVVEVALMPTAARSAARKRGYYGLVGAGLLGLAGAGFAILESQASAEARDIARTEAARPPSVAPEVSSAIEPVRTRADLADAKSRGQRYSLMSAVAFGAAGASLGVAIYYFIKERPIEVPNAPAPLAVTPVFDRGGLGVLVSSGVSW